MDTKKTIHNSIPITGPLKPWGNNATLNVGSDQKTTSLVDLSSARLRMTISMENTGGQPFVICKPAIAWITTYTFTPTFKGAGGETRSVLYTGNPGRGSAGYIYALMDRSSDNLSDQAYPENMLPPFTTSRTSLEISIPLRYLIDPLCTKRYLPISYFSLVPTFDSFLNIFSPPAGQPLFNASINAYYLEYPSYVVRSIPRELMYPDPRVTFVQSASFATPETSLLQTINVPGKLLRVFYFMLSETSSAAAGGAPNPFNFNPNPTSVITQHQLIVSGKVYPINPQYNAVFNATTETGLSRHYEEFLCIINKYQPSANTYLTYTTWRDNLRVYAIEVNDDGLYQQTIMSFQATLSTATANPFTLYIVSQYVPYVLDKKSEMRTIED